MSAGESIVGHQQTLDRAAMTSHQNNDQWEHRPPVSSKSAVQFLPSSISATSACGDDVDNPIATLQIDGSPCLGGLVVSEPPIPVFGKCTLNTVELGAFSHLAPSCTLHRVRVARYSSIGDGVKVLSAHPAEGLTTSPFPYQALSVSLSTLPPPTSDANRNRQTTLRSNQIRTQTS